MENQQIIKTNGNLSRADKKTAKKKAKKRFDIREEVTNTVIEMLETGGIEGWRKTWQTTNKGMHRNPVTDAVYSGINPILLMISAWRNNYDAPLWMTFRQAVSVGAKVRQGSKGTRLVFFKEVASKTEKDKDGNPVKYAMAKGFTVFNVAQLEDLPAEYLDMPELRPELERNERADAIVKASGAVVTVGASPLYNKTRDYVQMPEQGHFEDDNTYYATLLHELTHWTSHESRLNRDYSKRYEDKQEAYGLEELTAEMGAAYLCADCGLLDATVAEHVSYLDGWLKILKKDKCAIFTAASAAWKAYEHLAVAA